MNLERVKAHFEEDAPGYDDHIVRFVPYYIEQNEMMTILIPFEGTARIRGLDLGAGTGVLSEGILRKYPLAEVTVFDLADAMLDAARHRLAKFADRVEYRKGDFSRDDFGRGYDLVLSGLSIHHLEDSGKRRLYRRIFHALRPGGWFLNRDIVRGATERLDAVYLSLWREYIRSMGEDDAACMERYRAEDIPARIEDHLMWLRDAGFQEVGCHWQRINYAILGGQKPASEKDT
ncbi:MAG: class I SAM-dependent methyltransferase [Anaerolineales bacterium]